MGDVTGALAASEKAIDLDPNFAMAYALLATDYGNSGDSLRATENARKAFELRPLVRRQHLLLHTFQQLSHARRP